MQFSYRITGMHCQSCIEKIRNALSSHVSITALTLNPPQIIISAKSAPLLSNLNESLKAVGPYALHEEISEQGPQFSDYLPIYIIASYITLVAGINNSSGGGIAWEGFMQQFMAGFFLVFSAFKLLDLKGFATGYATYDLLAKFFYPYGYVYPFLELGLGILYLTAWHPHLTLICTIILMGFSSIGVINSLLRKQKFQCACLGTIFKVPLSGITLIEDLTMVFMAALSLWLM